MFWIFAALILLIILSVTITHRGAVRIGGCILLAALLSWGLYQRLDNKPAAQSMAPRGRASSPAAVTLPMELTTIELSDLRLSGGGAPFELRGRITNRTADLQLTAITLRTTRSDCFAGAVDPGGCTVIWRDQHWIRWLVPAGQTREFVETIWAHTPVPRTRGAIKDEFVLLEASGRRESAAPAAPQPSMQPEMQDK